MMVDVVDYMSKPGDGPTSFPTFVLGPGFSESCRTFGGRFRVSFTRVLCIVEYTVVELEGCVSGVCGLVNTISTHCME